MELAGGFYVSPAKLLAFLPVGLALESEVEPAVLLLLLGGELGVVYWAGCGRGRRAEVGHDLAIGAFVVEDAHVVVGGFSQLCGGGGTWMKSSSDSQWRAPLLRRIGVVIGNYYRLARGMVGKGRRGVDWS